MLNVHDTAPRTTQTGVVSAGSPNLLAVFMIAQRLQSCGAVPDQVLWIVQDPFQQSPASDGSPPHTQPDAQMAALHANGWYHTAAGGAEVDSGQAAEEPEGHGSAAAGAAQEQKLKSDV
jgi:hypothetical protein